MPRVSYDPVDFTVYDTTVYGEDVPAGVATLKGAWIRRVAGDPTQYSRTGTLLDEAIFETHHIQMDALTEVFGLGLRSTFVKSKRDASAFIGVQVSLDNGASFLAWVGGAWVAQDPDEEYTSRAVFDQNCATLPLVNPRNLGFRFRLRRDEAEDDTPVLQGVRAYVEWGYDPHYDVYSTILTKFKEDFRVPVSHQLRLSADTSTVVLNTEYTVDPGGDMEVFNTSTDPNKNVDLFATYVSNTRTITLSSEQESGSELLVKFFGIADVIVVRQDEMVHATKLPITVVRTDNRADPTDRDTGNLYDFKVGTTARRVRVRQYPVMREISVQAEHWTRSPTEAVASISPMIEVLSSSFRMKATGETPQLVETTPGRVKDSLGQSFYLGAWSGQLRLFFHAAKYTEYEGARSIQIRIEAMDREWLSDSLVAEA